MHVSRFIVLRCLQLKLHNVSDGFTRCPSIEAISDLMHSGREATRELISSCVTACGQSAVHMQMRAHVSAHMT